jgi:hypothetical protein
MSSISVKSPVLKLKLSLPKDKKKDLKSLFGESSPTTKYAHKIDKPLVKKEDKKQSSDSSLFLGIADNDDELDNFNLEINK